ncbi:hypothetical protein D3C79_1013910 [compost metagenome]
MVEGEHHDRDRQPQGNHQTIAHAGACAGKGDVLEDGAGPVRDQIHGQQHQHGDEREHQDAHGFHDRLLTETHDGHQADDQNQRQNGARR